ncbi:Poly A polymerase, head domain-containing protein [Artemisia annua]|uniref:Poly A polymerase, head domain-containing protein n=1 Tax=Artemisia annua TaxID=35608 RepID=A0A2U1KWJ2_ARTAN|nr:Poly A polymerase, head domain-containing protein [Artemisia annua]
MAIAVSQGFACRTQLSFNLPFINRVHKSVSFNNDHNSYQTSSARNVKGGNDDCNPHEWKKLCSKELGIRTSRITKPAKTVLNVLRKKGYDVYLVGGCVRDLVLKRTPKDFDILTTAELKEVMRAFPRCEIVGRRFPICHVHVDDAIVEVSSFSTTGRKFGRKSKSPMRKPSGCDECDFIRWQNCMQRDFTINGLMFDPFARIVYDYIGGMEDIQKAKVRCITPANTSFVEDCARILRGVRIAARLGFQFSRETSHFLKELSNSLLRLDKGRIHMEMNYMLAYGSAEASLRLLWKFGLLEILLPIQASYLVSHGFRRRDKRSNMLLSLFASLDKLLAPDRPCHSCLWVSLLAFHEALVEQPRDALVIGAFSIAVHSGGSLSDAVDIAREISQPHDTSFHEISEPIYSYSKDELMAEVIRLGASVKDALRRLTDENFVSQALIQYPQAPQSDMGHKWSNVPSVRRCSKTVKPPSIQSVFISWALSLKVSSIFECIRKGRNRRFVPKRGSEIDYDSLALGRLDEVRDIFGRVVFDTVYPTKLAEQ